nr:HNH endonuclease [Escherichia coli]
MVNLEEVNSLLEYNPDTGLFKWKPGLGKRSTLERAGTRDMTRHVAIEINGVKYFAHRLAWLITYGFWPPDVIDHINGNRTDNRICNLRLATLAENSRNRSAQKNGCGYKGVYYSKRQRKWVGQIRANGIKHHLGVFDNPEDAHKAYCIAAKNLHGDFSNAG